MKKIIFGSLFFFAVFWAFAHSHSLNLVNDEGENLCERISVPPEFKRTEEKKESFSSFIRAFPLKKEWSPVLLHNGRRKQNQSAHVAVFDLQIFGDGQNCVGSIIHLYSDFLMKNGKEDKISFRLTNGNLCSWSEWYEKSKEKRKLRTEIAGNLKKWTKFEKNASKNEIYAAYLKNVMANTSLLSIMEYDSRPVDFDSVKIGDILFDLGEFGHACLVVDICKNTKTGEKALLLAQGSTPAQEFHIIENPKRADDPWYHEEDFSVPLKTPEYTFPKNSFRRLTFLDFQK